jgi:two-component system sensor histidine kinase DegS
MEETWQEYEQIQRELREIELLIQQSTTEVEKLAQRNAQINNKVRSIEANLDTMPRQDIKETYKAAQDTQSRLFMMRGQVEQLQGKQSYLRRYADRLRLITETYRHDPGADSDAGGVSRGQNGAYSQIMNIIDAQERERLRLSKELHDGPAQSLTNLILQAEICERLFDRDSARAKTELSNLKDAVNNTFRKIREFIFELRPMMLDDLGLIPTLKQQVQDFENRHNIPTRLTILSPEQRLPAHIEVTLFRIIQGLLKNVPDHANATNIEVKLDIQPDKVMAAVVDNGVGFDLNDALAKAREQKKMGIISFQEQVSMLKGEITFDSNIGQGTVVNIWLPLA